MRAHGEGRTGAHDDGADGVGAVQVPRSRQRGHRVVEQRVYVHLLQALLADRPAR